MTIYGLSAPDDDERTSKCDPRGSCPADRIWPLTAHSPLDAPALGQLFAPLLSEGLVSTTTGFQVTAGSIACLVSFDLFLPFLGHLDQLYT